MFAAQFRDRRLDLLGVALIGIAAGTGGGLFRDLLLNQVPVALQLNWYLMVAVAAALLGMFLERLVQRLGRVITGLDALTIGLFCAIGTTKALTLGLPLDIERRPLMDQFLRMTEEGRAIPPKVVKDGPIFENVQRGDDIDLLKFPSPKWHPLDGGRYIGTGVCDILKDPDSDWVNIGPTA